MAGPGVNPGSGSVLYLSLQAHTPDGLKALHAAAIVRCALSWPALFAKLLSRSSLGFSHAAPPHQRPQEAQHGRSASGRGQFNRHRNGPEHPEAGAKTAAASQQRFAHIKLAA